MPGYLMGFLSAMACHNTRDARRDDTSSDTCVDVPLVTWATFGEGFLREACQGCHASTASDRHGAPEDVVFDDVEDAWAWADRIVARAASEPPSMPPMAGTSAEDRVRLVWWLTCAEEGL